MSMQNHYYVLTISFYVRRHSTQFQETGGYIWTFHIRCFADRFRLHLLAFFCFHFIMKQQQKLSSFFTQKRMGVQPQKHEDQPDKDGGEAGVFFSISVVQIFNNFYHSLTQTVLEMTQFKMPCGTYDPLWLISRLNIVDTRAILV